MPTLLFINGFRFFFYSNEGNEPPHVHVAKGDANGKIWLEPSVLVHLMIGFTKAEEKDILELIQTHSENFKQKWYVYFRQQ